MQWGKDCRDAPPVERHVTNRAGNGAGTALSDVSDCQSTDIEARQREPVRDIHEYADVETC
jgi:hypothetical protein